MRQVAIEYRHGASPDIHVRAILVLDFVVKLTLTGQLHDQIRRLPPSTKITGIEVGKAGELRLVT
jgi:hypothetical protein